MIKHEPIPNRDKENFTVFVEDTFKRMRSLVQYILYVIFQPDISLRDSAYTAGCKRLCSIAAGTTLLLEMLYIVRRNEARFAIQCTHKPPFLFGFMDCNIDSWTADCHYENVPPLSKLHEK